MSAGSQLFAALRKVGKFLIIVFRTVIAKMNLLTPGREEKKVETRATAATGEEIHRVREIITAFGGGDNIVTLDNCITRLRIEVKDIAQVDAEKIKSLGAKSVLVMGSGVQAIFGMEAESLCTEMAEYLGGSPQAAPAAAAHQATSDGSVSADH